MNIEVTFTPVEFEALQHRDLSGTVCVVFDVLRATSTIVTALAHGALSVHPVASMEEALSRRNADPDALLAGERDGLRIRASVSGGVEFDLGNSPREYTTTAVRNRRIITTTTNGTRAFVACRGARHIYAGSFLNLARTAQQVLNSGCEETILVCSGTGEAAAFEDILGVGALCEQLNAGQPGLVFRDSASAARDLFKASADDLETAMQKSSNARRLLAIPELCEDVDFCLCRDLFPIAVGAASDGSLRRIGAERV